MWCVRDLPSWSVGTLTDESSNRHVFVGNINKLMYLVQDNQHPIEVYLASTVAQTTLTCTPSVRHKYDCPTSTLLRGETFRLAIGNDNKPLFPVVIDSGRRARVGTPAATRTRYDYGRAVRPTETSGSTERPPGYYWGNIFCQNFVWHDRGGIRSRRHTQ